MMLKINVGVKEQREMARPRQVVIPSGGRPPTGLTVANHNSVIGRFAAQTRKRGITIVYA